MSVIRGRALELAVKRAAVDYRKDGRALLLQQFPRTATGPGGSVVFAGQAPIDFLGAWKIDGEIYGAALECKETAEPRLSLTDEKKGLHADQRATIQMFDDFGYDCRVIIDFTGAGECYIVPWFQIAAFCAAPWRRSLSLRWCRAHGQLVPSIKVDGDKSKAMFLDAEAHPESEKALLEIWDERKNKPIVSLDVDDDLDTLLDDAAPPSASAYAGMTKEQILDRIREATQLGIENAAKKQNRRQKWGAKR